MKPRCTAFIATSLDGFIARPDGGLDWLEAAQSLIPAGEDRGFAAYMATVDALVMGRSTFETVLGFGAWPYGETPVYVLSRTLKALPEGVPSTVSLHSLSPKALVDLAARERRTSLYIDGGVTIRAFLRAGLLDEITVTTIPVLIGSGRPLFGDPEAGDIPLRLVSTQGFPDGLVQTKYAIGRSD